MSSVMQFVRFDVHAETIAVAVAAPEGSVRSLGTIPNAPDAAQKLIKKLGPARTLRACYEAGPCGYVRYWQRTRPGVACEVVAPTRVPVRAGDRVKTDRRDAEKLARCFRNGDLTAVWVPDAAHEALRDVVRAREAAKADPLRARHRLRKFLLRQGQRRPKTIGAWSRAHLAWRKTVTFAQPAQAVVVDDDVAQLEHQGARVAHLERALDAAVAAAPPALRAVVRALQALRGVAQVTAVTIATEVGRLTRFAHPWQRMGYSGLVPREHSSGPTPRRGAITKTGNARVRRVLIEAAWAYRHRAAMDPTLRARQQGLPAPVVAIAWDAQQRLCGCYKRLVGTGKQPAETRTAVASELLGFVWAIGTAVAPTAAA